MPYHTNNSNSTRNFHINLKHILEMQKEKERVTLHDYLHAIVNESKHDKNYDNAQAIFGLLLKHLDHALSLRPQKIYILDEISIFQRAIATLIRYAPSPQKALDYTAYLLAQAPPLRTEHVETTCLINLIFVYRVDGTPDAMDKALDLIRMGLDRKVYNLEARMKHECDNVADVFVQVSRKVLAYHHLQFSMDMKSLEPYQRRPLRYSTY
ncbi:hypothetical protein K501DRAFT_276224 [Backusella circina FSU 941]|nr:hypothetical protein K501DRAFT_276224 [Backusella circina FSU 941]